MPSSSRQPAAGTREDEQVGRRCRARKKKKLQAIRSFESVMDILDVCAPLKCTFLRKLTSCVHNIETNLCVDKIAKSSPMWYVQVSQIHRISMMKCDRINQF
jgi:hypothetical protein